MSNSIAFSPNPPIQSDYPQTETYFITLCTHKRECLFGDIVAGKMRLNHLGEVVADEWQKFFEACSELNLHYWVIMPNHIHGIVGAIDPPVEVPPHHAPKLELAPRQSHSLRNFIATFKEIATNRLHPLRNRPDLPLWQQEVDQHIIPHRFAFHTFHQYITTNPHAWDWDKLHPDSPALV